MSGRALAKSSLLEEVMEGLNRKQKQLPSKLFYDERGSELFEQITGLKEYYLTRSEMSILKSNMAEISRMTGPRAMVIELGSGSSRKTRLLLDSLRHLAAYIPVDISKSYLKKTVKQLRLEYPHLLIKAVCRDYTGNFTLPPVKGHRSQLLFFPGSTIGNFHPDFARKFLERMSRMTRKETAMLVGVDLKKEKEVLEAAYNDRKGVTASFNKNMLVRLNREAGADFDIENFRHFAFYNGEKGRIEMHLVSEKEQKVRIGGTCFYFAEGESVHTENSYKYSPEDFQELVSPHFTVGKVWTDENACFSLHYLLKK